MQLTAKRSAAAAGLLLLMLALVLPLVAVLLRDPIVNSDPVREEIVAFLYEMTGRRIELAGDIEIDDFPWVTVVIGPGQLDNPAGYPGPPLLAWREIRLRVHYSSIYEDSPLLGPLTVDGLTVNLHRDARGRDNWSDIGPLVDTGPPDAPLALPSIELRGLKLRYLDETTSPQPIAKLEGAILQIKEISRGAGITEASHWKIRSISLQGGLQLAVGDRDTDGRLSLAANGIDARIPENEAVALAIDTSTLGLGPLQASLQAISFTPPDFTVGFRLEPAAIESMLELAGITQPLTGRADLLQLRRLQGVFRLRGGALSVEQLDAQVDRTRIRGGISLANLDGSEPVQLALQIDSVDLDTYAAAFDSGGDYDPEAPLVFPGKLLQGLPLAGRLRFEEIRTRGARLSGVTLDLESARGTPARRKAERAADAKSGSGGAGRS